MTKLGVGVVYKGKLPVPDIIGFVRDEASRTGSSFSQRVLDSGHTEITSVQGASWRKVIVGHLPQRMDWQIWERDGTSYVYYDQRFFPWYSAVVIFLCCLVALAFTAARHWLQSDWLTTSSLFSLLAGSAFLASLLLLFLIHHLLLAGSSSCEGLSPESLRRFSESRGVYLQPVKTDVSKRHMARTGAYVCFVLGVLAVLVTSAVPSAGTIRQHGAYVFLLIPLALCLVFGVAAMRRTITHPGFGLRFTAALPGLATVMSVLFLLATQIPLGIWSPLPTGHVEALRVAQAYLTSGEGEFPSLRVSPAHDVNATDVYSRLKAFRIICIASVATAALLTILSVAFLFHAFMVCLKQWPYSAHMHIFGAEPHIRLATSGTHFLRRLRVVLGTIWASMSVIIACGLLGVTFVAFQVADIGSTTTHGPRAGPGGSLSLILSCSFPKSLDSHRASQVADFVWISLCGAAYTPFLVSLLASYIQSRRTKQRLRDNHVDGHEGLQRLRETVRSLSTVANIHCPSISVQHHRIPFACSHRLSLLRRRHVVELSTRLVELLTAEELRAVLAHEIAHITLRHTLFHQSLRLIGRVTLVGDGFAHSFLDSFGLENSADTFAVNHLGAGRDALTCALWKISNIAAAERSSLGQVATALHAVGVSRMEVERIMQSGPHSLPTLQRVKLAAHLFKIQYMGLAYRAYWHPVLEDRISRLATWQKKTPMTA